MQKLVSLPARIKELKQAKELTEKALEEMATNKISIELLDVNVITREQKTG